MIIAGNMSPASSTINGKARFAVRWKVASTFSRHGRFGGEDPRQQLLADLHRALRPALLLRLEGVHLDGQLGGGDEVGQVHEPPAPHLGAVGEVEIFGEGVVLPAPASAMTSRATRPRCR